MDAAPADFSVALASLRVLHQIHRSPLPSRPPRQRRHGYSLRQVAAQSCIASLECSSLDS